MIYLISHQQIMEQEDIRNGTIEQMLHYCADKQELGLDIETTGLDPYTSRMLCAQIGDEHNQFVIDSSYYPVSSYKSLLEDKTKTFLGHNIKFDLKFFLDERVVIENVYDTYVSEQIVWNGFENMRKSLDFVSHRYTGEMLDKSIRSNIHREGLTTAVIRYAADDVRVLPAIKRAQMLRANKYHLINAIKLNNLFVPVMAYLEYSGFKLDTQLWQEKIDKDIEEMNRVKSELDQFIINANLSRFIERQLDLFDDTLKANINWASPKQVTELFKLFDINVQLDEDDDKESVSAKLLKKQINAHPIIPIYIRYRELMKRIGTYGINWYQFINPVTGRIHTKFQQWMNTGRMSSGGKDKNSKTKFINAQNIPSDEATRKCIIADEGNILVNADYSSQEVRLFVDRTRDEALLKMFDEGYKDMHAYTAWYLFSNIREEYPELSQEVLSEIKKYFADERQKSKFANFAIQFGGTGETIADNCNIPVEEGKAVYDQYFNTFRGVKAYFDRAYTAARMKGYIQYNDVTKSKYFIPHTLSQNKIKNRSYNYPIQGTAADMTKYAGILYWRHLVEKGLLFKVWISIICHDEYLIETPLDLAETEASELKRCMEVAGLRFCTRIPMTADPVITPYWHH